MSTGMAAGFAVNAVGPRSMATAKHIGLGVGSTITLNDGTTRKVVSAVSAPDGADVTVLNVDADLPVWSPASPVTIFNPADAMFVASGKTGSSEVRDTSGNLRGWFWGSDAGTLRWTHSSTKYAKSPLEQYEVGFDSEAGSFAMTGGDSGGGYYVKDQSGHWFLQGIGSQVVTYNGTIYVNGVCASQFRPGVGSTNLTYETSVMVMPRDWLQTFVPLAGDANADGAVNFNDLTALAQNFGKTGTWTMGDFTGDGLVNFNDLTALAQNYRGTLADFNAAWNSLRVPTAVAVPEPTTVLLAVASPLTMRRRRRAA